MKKLILFFALALIAVNISFGAELLPVTKQTFLYSEKEGQKLYLDKYIAGDDSQAKPCIIFMFGGGFIGGTRDNKEYIPYFDYMARQGYCVVSIDYRLGFKDYDPKMADGPTELIGRFVYTIGIAVQDLYDATVFVLGKAEQWNIDPKMIIANGSSAGAVSVLQGEYYLCNGHELAKVLPAGFNYAGVVSFAGAIFTIGQMDWPRKPCPIQMFHGDADRHVPYDKITEMGMGFFGPKFITSTLDSVKTAYDFRSVVDGTHALAVSPMNENRLDILSFLDNLVKDKRPDQINTSVKVIGRPAAGKNFTLMDYIGANFAQ